MDRAPPTQQHHRRPSGTRGLQRDTNTPTKIHKYPMCGGGSPSFLRAVCLDGDRIPSTQWMLKNIWLSVPAFCRSCDQGWVGLRKSRSSWSPSPVPRREHERSVTASVVATPQPTPVHRATLPFSSLVNYDVDAVQVGC